MVALKGREVISLYKLIIHENIYPLGDTQIP